MIFVSASPPSRRGVVRVVGLEENFFVILLFAVCVLRPVRVYAPVA